MRIERIALLRKQRVFLDFQWPSSLKNFSRFNLIYGWNGSGKTTISDLFRHLETKLPIISGEAKLQIDGSIVDLRKINADSLSPAIRVFNRDYVDLNVHTTDLAPIFYLGEESIEKQKAVRGNRAEIEKLTEEQISFENANRSAEQDRDKFCIEWASRIKELLSSSGRNPYNNYNKADYKARAESFSEESPTSKILTDAERLELMKQKDSQPKPSLASVAYKGQSIEGMLLRAKQLLKRSILSSVISEFESDPELSEWVRHGLGLHTGARKSIECRFCGQQIPPDRLTSLERHFNDDLNRLLADINSATRSINGEIDAIFAFAFPSELEFYDHLAYKVRIVSRQLSDWRNRVKELLTKVLFLLEEKRRNPFACVAPSSDESTAKIEDETQKQIINQLQELIKEHNEHTRNFETEIVRARERIEAHHVATSLSEFLAKEEAVTQSIARISENKDKIAELQAATAALEKEIVQHRRPAEELNSELNSYLGRTDLNVKVMENGYVLHRYEDPAANLSEGEAVAFALLYFLKSLQDKNFDIEHGIVVIDDPVSSLDANSIFGAYGYIRERTKVADQLFLLTHNATLFRLVKNWFGNEKKNSAFYMLETSVIQNRRNARVSELDRLLMKFESEYQYLFWVVSEFAHVNSEANGLEQFYHLPNLARRLLESFLSFRYPTLKGELYKQLSMSKFDSPKKSRIIRFLHTFSHIDALPEPEHDVSLLAEAPQVLKEVLELMEFEDAAHFTEMMKLIKPLTSAASPGD